MATTWTHGGWRREADQSARRDKLILHIEEVEGRLAGFQRQSGFQQTVDRYDLEEYLKRLEARLAELESALGLGATADYPRFVEARPVT